MGETYLNGRDGRLYIGEAAVAEAFMQPDADMYALPELISNPDFVPPGEYQKQSAKEWDREACVTYGHWVLKLLEEEGRETDPKVRITRGHIERLYSLGLGPSRTVITREFGPMCEFGEALGAHSGRMGDRYRDWSQEDFVANAARLAETIGRKPTEPDYQAWYDGLNGPGLYMIMTRIGSVRQLNERIGYPDVHSWTDDDYVNWGVRVRQANDGSPFTARLIRHLSKQKRGPSDGSIFKKFGSVGKFQLLVDEELARQTGEQAAEDAALMAGYGKLSRSGELQLPEGCEPGQVLSATAKYLVAQSCLPKADPERLAAIAAQPADRFMSSLLRQNPGLSAGEVEISAVSLGAFDRIWPMDEWRKYLHVPESELGYKRPPSLFAGRQ